MLHRKFFILISHNEEYLITFCKDRFITIHNVCRQWYLHNNPQSSLPWK